MVYAENKGESKAGKACWEGIEKGLERDRKGLGKG